MNNQPSRSQFSANSSTQVELDLLNSIVLDDIAYPWNPEAAESDSYFDSLEQELPLSDLLTDVEITSGCKQFLSQTDQLFSVIDIQNSLSEKFSGLAPNNLLNKLGKVAVNVVDQVNSLGSILSLSDQLVHCVSEVLPGWDLEDLEVMARPLAYSMRGSQNDAVENTLATIQSASWSDLSEVEQARLSLAIALYAIEKANN
ncbi:MAG: hypothetical protein F6K25_08310 [Okeania sp. SIO2G4]|uniref:hypothetical protein n=1 Tax=unclassified Okeania TaxID=2634635 RepID=UPI0013B8653D|nr:MULTISPECIES: hypothetical protein [unclassified Okeania]NEP05154.1 hypothetical protein [Okeania sp. SIO4D6]NEP39287.1 hypothetical protein [Okeania sp. SIO2H7]NEP71908.1 hypothetical protein [Okeania sp. SIO2G5]NEP93048.1 hypothetical protein [Okeania sp. SIO2F5]NEQ90716.1 hypothetical protein [Okeania sp. SIO2G4]